MIKDQPYKDTEIWFSASDAIEEGTWVNENGRPLAYTNWAAHQPDNHQGIQDCAATNWDLSNGLGRWDDKNCENQLPYACELGKLAFDHSFVHFGEK